MHAVQKANEKLAAMAPKAPAAAPAASTSATSSGISAGVYCHAGVHCHAAFALQSLVLKHCDMTETQLYRLAVQHTKTLEPCWFPLKLLRKT